MTATDDFTDQIEALRKKKNKPFSGAKHGVVANAGGQLRRSASTAGITNTAQIDKLAVESVHSGIVVALDSDCRAYRAEITSLKNLVAELQDKLRPDSEHYAEKVKLADEVKQLRQTTSDAAREREALKGTIGKLQAAGDGRDFEELLRRAREQLEERDREVSRLRGETRAADEARTEAVAAHAQVIQDFEGRQKAATKTLRAGSERIEQLTAEVQALLTANSVAVKRAEEAEEKAAEAEGLITRANAFEARAKAAEARARDLEAQAREAAQASGAAVGASEAARAAMAAAEAAKQATLFLEERIRELEMEVEVERVAVKEAVAARGLSDAAVEQMRGRVLELEGAHDASQVEALGLRAALEAAKAETERAKADLASFHLAEKARQQQQQQQQAAPPPPVPLTNGGSSSGSSNNTSPKGITSSLRPMPADGSEAQQLSRANQRIESLTAENAQLREKVEHMSILMMKDTGVARGAPTMSSAASSPLKMKK